MAGPASAKAKAGSPPPKLSAKEKAKAKEKANSVERQNEQQEPKPKGGLAVYVPPSNTGEGDCSGSALQSGELGLSHSVTDDGNKGDV